MSKQLNFPHMVGVRLSTEQFAAYLAESRRTGLPPSILAREVLSGARPPVTEQRRPLRRAQA